MAIKGGSMAVRHGVRRVFRRTSKGEASAGAQSEDRLYRRLSALGSTRGAVASTIDAYISEGKDVNKDDIDRCIREFRKYRRYPHALEMMEWMVLRKFKFGLTDHAVHLDLIAKVKGIDAAEDYFSGLPIKSRITSVCGTLLNCYCVEKMGDKAEMLFSKMLEEKMVVKALPYNNLMNLYLKLQMPEKVPVLWDEMKKRNVEPDTFTFNILMRSYSLLKDVEGVERIFEEMKLKHTKLGDWTTYSNLAIAYIDSGHHLKAKLALKKLEAEMNNRDRDAYHFLISLYSKLSDLHNAIRVWETMKSALKVVTNTSYLIMLQALKNLNDVKGMQKCYREWESAYLSYDVRLANTVISAYLKHDMLEEAELVLRKALDGSTGPFFSSAWDMFMKYFLKNKDVEQCLRMMKVPPSTEDWNVGSSKLDSFITAFNKDHHDMESVRELYITMKGITTARHRSLIYRSLLQAYISG